MDLQFSFEVSVSNGASRFANFDLWVLEEMQKFMGVWREKRKEKEEKEERWCSGSGSLQKQEQWWRRRGALELEGPSKPG
ncbi:hypothetical protein D8674_012043 [Pyrus ussuriensis x Pyrus communis]|uniref:Uncharacterized protein n=1 Tax=Pyrus ussuriensis x Pyrus communis TaxID=2448454 RepID=A0A5N5G0E6_9ROSA|nr:hypothetical protein D8674_012043 [Pyrus ussuriensis x Pyrus communis]